MTRGPKRGSTHKGSNNAFLLEFEVGDYCYVETTRDGYSHTMRTMNAPPGRRPPALAGRKFECKLYRALGTDLDDMRVLVRMERLA